MSKSSSPPYPSPFRSDCLSDRICLVTGGGSGIGYENAKQLAIHGAKVAIFGRRENILQSAINSFINNYNIPADHLLYFSGDVRRSEDCKRAIDSILSKWGGLNVLINGAAGNFLSPAESLSPNGFRTVIDIDTVGTFTMCHAAFQALKSSGDSIIINISANLHYSATWYQIHASAAKAAVDSLTATLALEWGEYNIRVNAIAPGPIADTPGFSKLGGDMSDKKGLDQLMSTIVPLKRAGTTMDIGLACVYLTSKASNFTSGAILVIDGAQWFGKPPIADRSYIQQYSAGIEKKQKQAATGQITKSKL